MRNASFIEDWIEEASKEAAREALEVDTLDVFQEQLNILESDIASPADWRSRNKTCR